MVAIEKSLPPVAKKCYPAFVNEANGKEPPEFSRGQIKWQCTKKGQEQYIHRQVVIGQWRWQFVYGAYF